MTVTRARLEQLAQMRQNQKPAPALTPKSPYGDEVKRQVQQQQERELQQGITTLKEESKQMNIALDAVRQAGYARAQFNSQPSPKP